MDPTQALTAFLSPTFWVLVVIIGLVVYGIRWLIENTALKIAKYFPDKYEPWWQWFHREVFLPIAPLVTGGLIGYFIEQYPYPEPFGATLWGRVFLGVITGVFSAFCYPRIMYYIKKLSGKFEEEADKINPEL